MEEVNVEEVKAYVVLKDNKMYKTYKTLQHARSGITHATTRYEHNPLTSRYERINNKTRYKIIMCVGQKEIDVEK